jgi:hypothetical protein
MWGRCPSDANTVTHQFEVKPISSRYLHGAFVVFSIIAITCRAGDKRYDPGRLVHVAVGGKMHDKRTQAKNAVLDGQFVHPFQFLKRIQTSLLAKGIS